MKSWKIAVLAVGAALTAATIPSPASDSAVVLGDSVNLRARPDLNSEVVGQVDEGQVLRMKSATREWVEVAPPEHIGLWVHADFVEDGQVAARRLNVRSGPGINFRVVDTLERGKALDVRQEFSDEWLKIAPPASASLWISRSLVEIPEKEVQDDPAPRVAVTPPEADDPPAPIVRRIEPRERVAAPPPGTLRFERPEPAAEHDVSRAVAAKAVELPDDWELIPLKGQGADTERTGELRAGGLWRLRRPTQFMLYNRRGGRLDLICYVHGNSEQMSRFAGRRVTLRGRQYWVRGVQQPVLVVDEIIPLSGADE